MNDVQRVSADGGTPVSVAVDRYASEYFASPSPDGSRLAFVSTRTGNGDLYVLTLASGELSRVTYDDAAEQLDAWS
ncbi:MAG TPA: hypothetical protein VM165_24325, partial [Planctomycetaceae bacterium]|nr:hypothetical protein [Planctomycetaceae bacterium]